MEILLCVLGFANLAGLGVLLYRDVTRPTMPAPPSLGAIQVVVSDAIRTAINERRSEGNAQIEERLVKLYSLADALRDLLAAARAKDEATAATPRPPLHAVLPPADGSGRARLRDRLNKKAALREARKVL